MRGMRTASCRGSLLVGLYYTPDSERGRVEVSSASGLCPALSEFGLWSAFVLAAAGKQVLVEDVIQRLAFAAQVLGSTNKEELVTRWKRLCEQ
ncbi:hypothetical protein DPMN_135682 [Dreissena polymorpha]|uniref:Uncharacterized protein n=1 Tax=Dreissena polymorpha TaxID=45954 RepID=A0A9D4G1E9_DREPO|nr:hypothetical protein DPMN_135682 [Dreissena polymorpha]